MKIKIRKDIYRIIPALLLFLAIFVLVVGNSKNPDLFATQYQYDNNMLSNEAFLVRMVQSLSHYLGLNSKGYRFICYCIGYFFIILGLKKCNVSYFSFWMIYMIYPMMMDVVQTDNFIAMCIFFYAIVSFDENRRWNKTRCVFLILASACFHIAFISFLPFIFLVNIYSKRYIKVVILFSVLLSIVILVLRNNLRIMLYYVLSQILNGDIRVNSYFAEDGNYGFLIFWVFHILFIVLLLISDKYTKDDENNPNSFVLIVKKLLVYSILFFPLYAIDSNFFRLSRNLIPLIIISVLQNNTCDEVKQYRKYNILFSALVFFLIFSVDILINNFDSIFIPFFHNNYILWGN